jgi:hypothetical protein
VAVVPLGEEMRSKVDPSRSATAPHLYSLIPGGFICRAGARVGSSMSNGQGGHFSGTAVTGSNVYNEPGADYLSRTSAPLSCPSRTPPH